MVDFHFHPHSSQSLPHLHSEAVPTTVLDRNTVQNSLNCSINFPIELKKIQPNHSHHHVLLNENSRIDRGF